MLNCPFCTSSSTCELTQKTALGDRTFRCSACKHRFNERTGTAFNHRQFPTDIVLLVVLWRLRYKLSLRDVAEMFLVRGFDFIHEAVREWETRFALLLTERAEQARAQAATLVARLAETTGDSPLRAPFLGAATDYSSGPAAPTG